MYSKVPSGKTMVVRKRIINEITKNAVWKFKIRIKLYL